MTPIDPLFYQAITNPEQYVIVWDEPNIYGGNARMDCPVTRAIDNIRVRWNEYGGIGTSKEMALDTFLVNHYAWIEER